MLSPMRTRRATALMMLRRQLLPYMVSLQRFDTGGQLYTGIAADCLTRVSIQCALT